MVVTQTSPGSPCREELGVMDPFHGKGRNIWFCIWGLWVQPTATVGEGKLIIMSDREAVITLSLHT